jgi:hypothetical protein
MKNLLVLLLVVLVAAPSWAQLDRSVSQPRVQALRVIFAPHVSEELDYLADTLRVETVRCLIGVVNGEDATIDLAWQPPIKLSTPNQVEYQSCPLATLAVWHNHPPIPSEAPEYGCYLSATDIREALHERAPPIQIVQVTANVACWWSKWEIAKTGLAPVLFPRGRQRWGRSLLNETVCRAELRHVTACRLLLACERDGQMAETCRPPKPAEDVEGPVPKR